MIMFCGLPVMVMTLPMLAAVARARRYGAAGTPAWAVISRSSGVPSRHTVSLSSKAAPAPAVNTTRANRVCGLRQRLKARKASQVGKPLLRRMFNSSIKPNNTARVLRSMAAAA